MYAITIDGKSWRAIGSVGELAVGEAPYYDDPPVLVDGSLGIRWDSEREAWQPLSVEEAGNADKRVKSARVNDLRQIHETSGFQFSGKLFQSDQRSYDRIAAAAQTALVAIVTQQPFPPIDWIAADNSAMTLDAQGVLGMQASFVRYGLRLHEHAQTLKAAINAGQEIDIENGWPE